MTVPLPAGELRASSLARKDGIDANAGEWCAVTAVPLLAPADVHVWWLPLHVADSMHAAMALLLSDGERAVVDRETDAVARRLKTVARGWRRLVLAGYAGHPAAHLHFGTTRSGKPALLGGGHALRFSTAHHATHAALAVARNLDVGVDVESCAAEPHLRRDAASLMDRDADPAGARRHRWPFTRAWVTIEACAKLRGLGLGRMTEERVPRPAWLSTFRAVDSGASSPPVLGALACAAAPKRVRWLVPHAG